MIFFGFFTRRLRRQLRLVATGVAVGGSGAAVGGGGEGGILKVETRESAAGGGHGRGGSEGHRQTTLSIERQRKFGSGWPWAGWDGRKIFACDGQFSFLHVLSFSFWKMALEVEQGVTTHSPAAGRSVRGREG